MGSLKTLLLDSVIDKSGVTVDINGLCGSGKILGLYFSAHWCPPCRAFTPQLVSVYNKLKESNKNFEFVFVSSDRDQASFDEYYKDMPWHAIPYSNRDLKAKLSKKFKIQGIPSLIIMDMATGKVITSDGRGCVAENPQGENFPWHPKMFSEVIGNSLISNTGKDVPMSSLSNKIKMLYFSAHWCPPCKAFTPQLVELYTKLQNAGKNMEVIFVSSDRSQDSFSQYFSQMPWLALPFADHRCKQLSKAYGIEGIPSLVVLDEAGQIITKEGRAFVNDDPDGEDFPWYPTALMELTGASSSKLNEDTCLILFTDGKEEDEAFAHELLGEIAEEHFHKQDEQTLFFFYSFDDDFCDTVKEFIQLGETTSPQLVILDIPELRVYICKEDKPYTPAVVQEFIMKFEKRELEGMTIAH